MMRRTQVPARIIKAFKTREQRAKVEQMFKRLYDEYMRAEWYRFQDTDGAYLPDEREVERVAWRKVELKLFGDL